jgi:hypothetical protein
VAATAAVPSSAASTTDTAVVPSDPVPYLSAAAFAVPAASEDELEQILAAEEKLMAATAAATATAASVAATGPTSVVAPVTSSDTASTVTLGSPAAVDAAVAPAALHAHSSSILDPVPPLPDELAGPLVETSDDNGVEQAAAEAEEEEEEDGGFGHFTIPDQPSSDPFAIAAAAVPAVAASAAAEEDLSFEPEEEEDSEQAIEARRGRRTAQIIRAEQRLRSLHVEVDLCASKMCRLLLLAQQDSFAHLSLAQSIVQALQPDM